MTCKKFIAAALVTLPLTFGGTAALAQEIVIGAAANPGGMVVFVAQEKGLFAKNGVDAKVEVRNTGPELSRGLRAGEFQFTPAAFTNLPAARERGLDVRGVVGYVGAAYVKPTSDNQMGIIAAKDSGIETIADLVGKNIGVTFGTTGDTYLQALLAAHDILITDVGRVNTAPPSLTSVLDTGGVDAIVAWAPFLERTLERVEAH